MDDFEVRRKLNQLKKETWREQNHARLHESQRTQEDVMPVPKPNSFFAILAGGFAGLGVAVCAAAAVYYTTKLMTGSPLSVYMHRFRPTPMYWAALSCVLAVGASAGGYIAARIVSRAAIIHGVIVGLLLVLPLLIIQESPYMFIICPIFSIIGSACVPIE